MTEQISQQVHQMTTEQLERMAEWMSRVTAQTFEDRMFALEVAQELQRRESAMTTTTDDARTITALIKLIDRSTSEGR